MGTIHSILHRHWGYDAFRPLQEEIITTVLAGEDCLALLPTGGGKSLCFQVPALAKEGLCLVISPLIALMKDQVENLRKKNITAFAIHSGLSRKEVINVLSLAGNSNCKFLYVSPERLETKLFQEFLPSLGVKLIAVDEAHCISQWGYDFRPSYLRIAALREELPGVPVLALTASATALVQEDICEKLLFEKRTIFRQSFLRPNLSYSAFNISSKINKLIDVLSKVNGCAIVYCRSRKRTRETSDLLRMHGISSDFYHAGLTQQQRNDKQDNWLKNTNRVMVCTNAFGMGIDKPDVRLVVHLDVPECLENYYQEAGRAGRDGKKSYAVLLYNDEEIDDLEESVSTRFPPIAKIRDIYQAIMNYLQVPSGHGEGNYYEFDLFGLIKTFELDGAAVISAIRTLEQEGALYFNEQVFQPGTVEVTASREMLEETENASPVLSDLLKALLRNYEGILDQPCNIYEKQIAFTLRRTEEDIIAGLKLLHARSMVRYVPQKEKPQIFLPANRVRSDDLYIDQIKYQKRKQLYLARIRKIIEYCIDDVTCRSTLIGNYFGDAEIAVCGICDNCLAAKRSPVSAGEFEQIQQLILGQLSQARLALDNLLATVPGFPKYKIMEVIRFLESEEAIMVNEQGVIMIRS